VQKAEPRFSAIFVRESGRLTCLKSEVTKAVMTEI
jgi:hypothetical protein